MTGLQEATKEQLARVFSFTEELNKQVAEEFGDRETLSVLPATPVVATFTSSVELPGTKAAYGPFQANQEKIMLQQKFGLLNPQLTASEQNLIVQEERRNERRRR